MLNYPVKETTTRRWDKILLGGLARSVLEDFYYQVRVVSWTGTWW